MGKGDILFEAINDIISYMVEIGVEIEQDTQLMCALIEMRKAMYNYDAFLPIISQPGEPVKFGTAPPLTDDKARTVILKWIQDVKNS